MRTDCKAGLRDAPRHRVARAPGMIKFRNRREAATQR
jgi:hypothetical protein